LTIGPIDVDDRLTLLWHDGAHGIESKVCHFTVMNDRQQGHEKKKEMRSVHTGGRHMFADIESLLTFLIEQRCLSPDGMM
jgi:hypothetical protein